MDVLIFEEAPKVYASDAQANALVVPVVLPSIQLAMLRDVAPMWAF